MFWKNLQKTIVLFLVFLVVQLASQAKELNLEPKVDERVELLSIVFHLAGNPEYNQAKIRSYEKEVDQYFARFKTDPVILMSTKLRQSSGVALDAVVKMAVALSPPPDLAPIVPFTATVPERRWGEDNASEFADKLRKFYIKTKFHDFYSAHKALYDTAESRVQSVLRWLTLSWFDKFYGEAPRGKFNLLIGLLDGPNSYASRVVYPNGREDLFAIIGCDKIDDSGNPSFEADTGTTIVHEFNHSYINPLVHAHISDFSCAEPIFDAVSMEMKNQSYGNYETMLCESLVRAGEVMYMEYTGESAEHVRKKIREEQFRGFVWMDELCKLLRKYNLQRSTYPGLNSFMPNIAVFFSEYEKKVPEVLAELKRLRVHVTGIQPFSNHSQEVAPGTKEMIISFDKVLEPRIYTFCDETGGGDYYPVVSKPEFLPGNQSIKFHLSLKPDQKYSFKLYSTDFRGVDGAPLESYYIDFKTSK